MDAVISACGLYRYTLTRAWDDKKPSVAWCMCNPSKADGMKDDATLRRIVDFSRRWDYGSLVVVNLFAFRSTDPKELLSATDPIGPNNDMYIEKETKGRLVVCAWGNSFLSFGWKFRERPWRTKKVMSEALGLRCLGYTKSTPRQPLHPLRLAASTALEMIA